MSKLILQHETHRFWVCFIAPQLGLTATPLNRPFRG